MMATGLVAIDSTILATAVPSVVADLGGFAQFPWLFSIYLLAQSVSVPLYGKFADIVGRKPMMLLGVGIFLASSVLCGAAWSMTSLIVFRAVQGLGAGAVLPIGQTIVADIYSLSERAKVIGYFASVWAISSVVGPSLGGVFSDYVSWRWIFFINVPIAVLAMTMLQRGFTERVANRTSYTIDYAGAALLAAGGSLLILGLLAGGVSWAWGSPTSITVMTAAGLLLILFGLVERRAAEPILPLWVFRRRVLVGSNAATLCVGVLLIGLTSYVPLYAQNVLGARALVAGFAVAALTLGWPVAATLSGRLYLRFGFRTTALLGAAFAIAGAVVLITVSPTSSVFQLALGCWVIGVGLGFISAPALVAAQASADWRTRGVVTGANLFARSVGSAIGIAVFGAIVNASVAVHTTDPKHLPTDVLAPAIHSVYLGTGAVALVVIVAIALMPGGVPSTDTQSSSDGTEDTSQVRPAAT